MEADDRRFRDRVIALGNKGVDKMEEYFDGKRSGTDMVAEASKMIDQAVKVSNRNDTRDSVRVSQAIRVMSIIPPEQREEYIAATIPDTKPYLLARPKVVKAGKA